MKEEFRKYIIDLYRDVPISLYEGLLSILFFGAMVLVSFWGWKKGLKKIAGLLFAEYVFLIYCSTVIFRNFAEICGYEFIPFWSYARTDLFVENIMNVVVFVPAGILLGCALRSMTWWKVLLIGCGISVSIEAMQYFYHRGFAETDDVMHNTLGCILGYGVYLMIQGLWNKVLSNKSIEG